MKFPFTLLALLCLSLSPTLVRAQKPDRAQKQQFSERITNILYWVYIEGDTMFQDVPALDAMVSAELQSKGYTPDKISMPPDQADSVSAWRKNVISGLDSTRAFLEFAFTVLIDSSASETPGVTHLYVADPTSGTILVNSPRTDNTHNSGIRLFFRGMVTVFAGGMPVVPGTLSPLLHKNSIRSHEDPKETINLLLEDIPEHTQPDNELAQFSVNTPKAEFFLGFGYYFPSSMDVKGGTADFHGDGFGSIEVGLGFTRNMDLVASFQRQHTRFDLNSTSAQREDEPVGINQNFVLVGMNYNFRIGKTWTLFLGGLLGGVNLVPTDDFYRNVWYFDLVGQGGVKIYLVKWFGFRAQVQASYQLHPEGAPFLYSDLPTYYPIPAYSNMLQLGGNIGIFFRVGAGWR